MNRDAIIASDIIEILKSPARDSLVPHLSMRLMKTEKEVRESLKDSILREHENPIDGIDVVLSAQSWPVIYRFVLRHNSLIAIIVEYGVATKAFKKVFTSVEDKIVELFAHSTKHHIKEVPDAYSTYVWEYLEHSCCLHVLNDERFYINPLLFDTLAPYFGDEIDGTFVRESRLFGNRLALLPTIGVTFACDSSTRDLCMHYVNSDLKRRTAILQVP